jgi:glycosyltransferase involved in cell wall biosynthesis
LDPEERGILLCVGANVWYKNRRGVLRIYEHYAKRLSSPLPLWVVGPQPSPMEKREIATRVSPGRVRFVQGIDHRCLQAAYSLARASLFPSLAEGFGWPILEAMACGCPVLTTGEAPMTEVGGSAARYIPRLVHGDDIDAWASRCADELMDLLALSERERAALIQAGISQAARFDSDRAIDAYIDVYRRVLELEHGSRSASDGGTSRQARPRTEGAG